MVIPEALKEFSNPCLEDSTRRRPLKVSRERDEPKDKCVYWLRVMIDKTCWSQKAMVVEVLIAQAKVPRASKSC